MKLFTSKTQRNARLLQCAALGMTLVFFGAAILMTDPVTLIVDWQLSLKPYTLLSKLYEVPPVDVYITVYMFNYTNSDAFIAGIDTKIKIAEIGPYVYKEVLSNHNVTLHEANNTVTYTPRREYIFSPERSVGDPKVDHIRAPNIPYMGVVSQASDISMFASLGLTALTRRLNSQPIMDISVHDYMWGYEDHLVSLASKIMPSLIDFSTFGIMEKLFREGNESNVFNMHLPERKDAVGVKLPNSPRGYSIHSVNGDRGFKNWGYDDSTNGTNCNRISGSHDATLFPRDMNKNDSFLIFRKTFCRRLPLTFNRTLTFDGLDAFEFTLAPHIFDEDLQNENTSCFCKNNHCLKKGLGNASPCYYNMPLAVSYPHFLYADPSLLVPFEGLSPSIERHASKFVLQPQLGVPLHAHMRLQANQVVSNIKFNSLMEPFKNLVLPLLWIDFTIDNLSTSLHILSHLIKTGFPMMQLILALCLIFFGVYQLSIAFHLCFWSLPTAKHKSDHGEKEANALGGYSIVASLQSSLPAECVKQEAQRLLDDERKLGEV
ncbi:scavenger receptor class B member 1 [Drosophila grimshawi]|uniref:scavenger receptor class B member 1 n=1 Tax=Drosophila grimshawi TaxID=7222 RepID=UPI000C8700C4|nr:scavenger receptor class B member 1 [Drosophila grimshawi]